MNTEFDKKNGVLVNAFIFAIGLIIILLAIVLKVNSKINDMVQTILLSIGTSIVASSVVSYISGKYLTESKRVDGVIKKWKLYNLYETKQKMNNDSNEFLDTCTGNIDIIAEGMNNFLDAKQSKLEELMKKGVKIRIISCDNSDMLRLKARDESFGQGGADEETWKVVSLYKTVNGWKTNNKYNVELKFHDSYPAFSYLRIDSHVFFSPNLWMHKSQQTFAIGFWLEGAGGKYFSREFDILWNSGFVHDDCKINNSDSEK